MKTSRVIQLIFLLTLTIPFFISAQVSWSPDHIYYGKGGKLAYTPDEQGNIIPDFSHVGYRFGDEPIPDIPTVVEVEPVEGDDGATIQAAINSLYSVTPDENGFRGAVLLKKGTYQVSGQITISASGIVLRGEGDTDDGTVIIAEGTTKRELIRVDSGASRSVQSASRVSIAESYVPVGRKFVVVANGSSFAAGDQIVLYRPGTAQWITDIKMDQIPPRSDGGTVSQWKATSYSFYFERILTRVSGDTLFFRNPVVMAMETKYGGGAVYKYTFNRLQNIGIEDLCLKSTYASDIDENHSWTGISIRSAEHGWVRNVTSWYFAFGCVQLERNSKFFTVANCHVREPKSIITGGRRYSFQIIGSLHLVTGCTSDEARHDYATSSRVTGPNVFTNSTATNTHSDIGPHHRWAMGTLYDRIVSDGNINVQDRDNMGSGHGWAGANQVFWNCKGSASVCQNPWASAKNYNFGFMGAKKTGARANRPDGEWVGHNVPGIFPASLYETQLDERLNGTTVFSALPQLVALNDTTYQMQFSFPLNPDQVITENFEVTLSQPIGNFTFRIAQQDAYSVVITSDDFNRLTDTTILTVKTSNLTSAEGLSLTGSNSATYTIPVMRPTVTGISKFTDNVNGTAEASSDKTGYIYLIKYALNVTTLAELDSLVNANLGRKAAAPEAGTVITISTKGLPGGYYEFYATDVIGRVSAPSTAWISVTQTGPITGLDSPAQKNRFSVYRQNQQIVINPGDNLPYKIDVHTITGQKIFQDNNLLGIHSLDINNYRGVVIIRKQSENGTEVLKIGIE